MAEIEHRAKVREAKLIKEAENMSKELNFDDITRGIGAYESIGSAKGVK
jgi:hypothetical protein